MGAPHPQPLIGHVEARVERSLPRFLLPPHEFPRPSPSAWTPGGSLDKAFQGLKNMPKGQNCKPPR